MSLTINGLPVPVIEPATYFIGVDEVARGCFAGPVVACAVCLNSSKIISSITSNTAIPKIADSKKLTPAARQLAEGWIKAHSSSYSICQASVAEIDSLNIREATFLAMNRALVDCISKLPVQDPNINSNINIRVIIDGNAFKVMPGFTDLLSKPNISFFTQVKGDATNLSIACASILAKEYRDNLLDELVINEPDLAKYNWKQNRAYGTSEHIKFIKQYGISSHHRRSFLKKYLTAGANSS